MIYYLLYKTPLINRTCMYLCMYLCMTGPPSPPFIRRSGSATDIRNASRLGFVVIHMIFRLVKETAWLVLYAYIPFHKHVKRTARVETHWLCCGTLLCMFPNIAYSTVSRKNRTGLQTQATSGMSPQDYLIKYAYFDKILFRTVCFYQ